VCGYPSLEFIIFLLSDFGCMLLSLCLFRMCIPILCFVYVCTCTQLVFMWGNLGLASEERKEVPVPLLLPGQVGVVSVAFVAPVMEGTYTSHWRLAHCGCQFGPRVWCSIVVDLGDGRNAPGHQSKPLASLITNDTMYNCRENVNCWHARLDLPLSVTSAVPIFLVVYLSI